MSALILYIIISIVLTIGAYSDYKTYKVSNRYIFMILLVTFLTYAWQGYYDGQREEIYKFIIFMGVGYVLMYITHRFKLWGGADAKLLWGLIPALAFPYEGYFLSTLAILGYYITFSLMLFSTGLLLMIRKENIKIPVFMIFAVSYILFTGYKVI